MVVKSRKFWAAVVGIAISLFGERGGVDEVGLIAAVVVVVGYILGTAIEGLKVE